MTDDEIQILAFLKERHMTRSELLEQFREAHPKNANVNVGVLLDQSLALLHASRYISSINDSWFITKPGRVAFKQSVKGEDDQGYTASFRKAPLLRVFR